MQFFRCVAVVVAVGLPAFVIAEGSRDALFQSQLSVLDNRSALQYNMVRLQPPRAVVPTIASKSPNYVGRYTGPYLEVARAAARWHYIPEDLFLRLVKQESGWNAQARSVKGAMGLAQLMPQTARALGVDASDPSQNLEGGAQYLRRQYETFGTWRLALAAYNAGPGAVERYNGVPPYKETQNYVRIIWGS